VKCEISGGHGSVAEQLNLLQCDAVVGEPFETFEGITFRHWVSLSGHLKALRSVIE
jgi:hypothetical protein